MLRFRFELRPLADVSPWGRGLHWFGLTDGWYWITTDAGFHLRSDHVLDLGYLTEAPHLRCWRHTAGGRDVVTLRQLDPRAFEGPELLDVTVPAAEFFAAVAEFDRELIAAMAERVAELERTGPPPGIELDLPHLRAEHTQRSRWLEQRLAAPRHVDWPAVRAGIARISSWPVQPDDERQLPGSAPDQR